jgi:gamma-D-glutamyl-L-lysine dipeptidyl-peptidase
MKKLTIRIGFLLLLLLSGTFIMAQTLSCKKLSQELYSLEKQLVPDKRVAILDIELTDTLQPTLVVSGKTDLPGAKETIIRFLKGKNIRFVDSIRVLPNASLGNKTWALASLSVSNLRSQPGHASELVSQALMGTPMKVLDAKNGWLLVQTPDHYIGWMEAIQLKRLNQAEMNTWKTADRYLFNLLSGFAYDAPNEKGAIMSDLVLGDLFEVEGVVKNYLKFRTPDGRTGYVPKEQCLSFKDWSKSEPSVQSIMSVAKSMTGVPYLWGGSSSKAVDCSGFVKVAFYSKGIILARDASQQAKYGEPVDFTSIANLQEGDLLFFGPSPQRIVHVGIYIAGGNFINSSGWVHISSIMPGDPKYSSSRNLAGACRVLNSLNTEGIVLVKDHPWYSPQSPVK